MLCLLQITSFESSRIFVVSHNELIVWKYSISNLNLTEREAKDRAGSKQNGLKVMRKRIDVL